MMQEALEDEELQYIEVKIQNPLKEESYITYEILLETNDSSFTLEKTKIRRRYSDFRTLWSMLRKQFPCSKLPSLPPRYPFRKVDADFIEKRRARLQGSLVELLTNRIFLSSRALHLFLQSYYSMEEIKDILSGRILSAKSSKVKSLPQPVGNKAPCEEIYSSVDSGNELDTEYVDSNSIHSPSLTNKRVSFCDEVTVAEIHIHECDSTG